MKRIKVSDITGAQNAGTREDAIVVAEQAEEGSVVDFSDIKYISGAFADELISRLSAEQIDRIIESAPEHISKLFQAVRNRRVSA